MKRISQIAVLGLLLLAMGCTSPGVPRGARVVGGGTLINWTPPEDGTVLLVEETTETTLTTMSVKNGTLFTFNASNDDGASVLKSAFATLPPNARYVLYFVPSRSPK